MIIPDFRVDAIHTFQVCTLNRLGFLPRVSLVNKSYKCPKLAGDFVVNVSVFRGGKRVLFREGITRVPVGCQTDFDCTSLVDTGCDSESVVIFHLIPERFQSVEKVSIEKKDLWDLMTAQDHYIEYYDRTGYSAGVLYQCGPFNYDKLSLERSTIIQAPKIYTSSSILTYLSITHVGFDEPYLSNAGLTMTIVDEKGLVTKNWHETISPFSTKLINVSEKMLPVVDERPHEPQFGCLYAFSSNATVVPLTISHNETTGTLAVEHSLPPTYYGYQVTGGVRSEIVSKLKGHKLFAQLEGMHAN
jgi:hypothetical protein